MGSLRDAIDVLHLFPCVVSDLRSAHTFPERMNDLTWRLEDEAR